MKTNCKSVFKKINILVVFLLFGWSITAQVGIGTTTPDAQVDIVAPAATGNALQVNHDNTSNGSSSIWLRNFGLGRSLNLQSLNTANNIPALQISQIGTGANARGLDILMDPTSSAIGLAVFQNGANDGIYVNPTGTGYGLFNQITGSGGAIYNLLEGTSTLGIFQDLSQNGGVAEYINLEVQDGTGVYVNATNNPAVPTSGGDSFSLLSDVYTNTPTGAGLVYGGILAGTQYGNGVGVIVNHQGLQGRNAEFNVNNPGNNDPVIFATSQGGGSVIIGENQNNTIVGTAYVADFAYTGTDVADHVGVFGFSVPAAGWGIGSIGQGGWYGMFSVGDSGATGVKTFTIDHPEDPERKILKHFSIESNEVLNMYRGTEIFDANGKAVVNLPDYYDSINKNPSYQLTPIGAAMPNLYIESEISNGKFIIAGGEPNKKVSWQITSERNDPYLKQNPEQREVVVIKEGERNGKYLNPELYGQPKEKGMFFNANNENQKVNKIHNPVLDTLDQLKAKRDKMTKLEPSEEEVVANTNGN